ncbi:MAG: ribulose-phosphate 3-epimerase [Phycisphaerales bacterium]
MPLVAPSILSADFARLAEDAQRTLDAGCDVLHCDVMDGHFAPNLTFGPAVIESLRKALPEAVLDVHLMVEQPQAFIAPFAKAGADHFTFHVETAGDHAETIRQIRAAGMTAGIAINPPTPLETVLPWVEHVDMVLVMSVNPGFSGQSFIPEVLDKVRAISPMLRPDQRLEMDGGVSPKTAAACREAGCDLLVAGSAIYGADDVAAAAAAIRGPERPGGAATITTHDSRATGAPSDRAASSAG